MNLSYAMEFYNKMIKGKTAMSFAHSDIQEVTHAGCPHSVYKYSLKPLLQGLGYSIIDDYEPFINHNGIKSKRKRFFIQLEEKGNG